MDGSKDEVSRESIEKKVARKQYQGLTNFHEPHAAYRHPPYSPPPLSPSRLSILVESRKARAGTKFTPRSACSDHVGARVVAWS